MKIKKVILPAVGLAVVAFLVWSSVTESTPVETATIVRGVARTFVEEEGRTRVVNRFVVAAPVDGRLLRLSHEEGDAVTRGEVVAEMDPLALTSRVAQAEARLGEMESRLSGVDRRRPKAEEIERSKLAEKAAAEAHELAGHALAEARAANEKAARDAGRARLLRAEGTISESELEAAELLETQAAQALVSRELSLRIRHLEEESAELATKIFVESASDVDWEGAVHRHGIDGLRAELAVLRDDLRRAELKSPIDGVILRRFIESETPVAAGTPILEVGSLTDLEIEADVLSEDAAHMREGMDVEVFGRALGDATVPGKLARIHPSAFMKISSLGVEQQRVTVVIAFDATGRHLGDRFRVDVRVILDERKDALLVPESALFRTAGDWHTFRVEEGRARLTRAETGLRDGRRREILSGLSEGDRVIIHPDETLSDRDRVEAAE